MKKEISLHKKYFEEYKNMPEDYINTYEGFLESQLKERDEIIEKKQTIIDMQSETINRAVDIFAAFENELTSKTKQDEPEII